MQKGTKQMFSHLHQTSLFNKGFYCIAKKRTLTCRINVGNLFVGQKAKRYESLNLYSGTSARTKRVQWSPIPKRGFTFCLVTFLVPLQEQPPPPPPPQPRLVRFLSVNSCSIWKFVCVQTTCRETFFHFT